MQASSSPLLHFPVLSKADFVFFRLLGPGLGNLLFPLYRAFQGQQLMGGELVFPQFAQLKPGPWLRRETDARAYSDLFNPRRGAEILKHVRALALIHLSNGEKVKQYEGLATHFIGLDPCLRLPFIELLTSRYSRADRLAENTAAVSRADICVHIRRGDFLPSNAAMASHGSMNFRIGDDWYVQATAHARHLSPSGQVRVFTDAPSLPASLLEALGADEVDQSPDALFSLLRMSAHGTLVASRSSFSLWAAFLGHSRLIIPESFALDRYMPDGIIDTLRC